MNNPDSGNVLRRRRDDLSGLGVDELRARWRAAVRSYGGEDDLRAKSTEYPRAEKLYDIVRADGRIRLMLEYDEENPMPDLAEYGQRRQVESILGLEAPLEALMAETESRWLTKDFEGEARVLEEFAVSNPQRDEIMELAAEARRDAAALTGGTTATKPKRRGLS